MYYICNHPPCYIEAAAICKSYGLEVETCIEYIYHRHCRPRSHKQDVQEYYKKNFLQYPVDLLSSYPDIRDFRRTYHTVEEANAAIEAEK